MYRRVPRADANNKAYTAESHDRPLQSSTQHQLPRLHDLVRWDRLQWDVHTLCYMHCLKADLPCVIFLCVIYRALLTGRIKAAPLVQQPNYRLLEDHAVIPQQNRCIINVLTAAAICALFSLLCAELRALILLAGTSIVFISRDQSHVSRFRGLGLLV